MNRTILLCIGIGLLVGGVVLLIFGLDARDSFGSDVSRFFTGNPTDRAMQLMVGGIFVGIAGAVMTVLSLVSFRHATK